MEQRLVGLDRHGAEAVHPAQVVHAIHRHDHRGGCGVIESQRVRGLPLTTPNPSHQRRTWNALAHRWRGEELIAVAEVVPVDQFLEWYPGWTPELHRIAVGRRASRPVHQG